MSISPKLKSFEFRIFIYLSLGMVLMGLTPLKANSGIVEGEGERWMDDEVLVYFADSTMVPVTLDSLSAGFPFQAWTQVTEKVYLGDLLAESDERQIAEQIQNSGWENIRGASVNSVMEFVQEEGESRGEIHTPIEMKPECSACTEPLFEEQWYLNKSCLNVCGAWSESLGFDEDVVVVVLDSGIDLGHEEFVGDIDVGGGGRIQLVSFSGEMGMEAPWEELGQDYFGHGTKMAGIVGAGQNGVGISGVAPEAQLIIGDIAFCSSYGACNETSTVVWLRAFSEIGEWAKDNPSKRFVVNVSWDIQFTPFVDGFPALVDAFNSMAESHNVLVVAAMGNSAYCVIVHPPVTAAYSAYPALFSGESDALYWENIDNMVVSVGGVSGYYDEGREHYRLKAYDRSSYSAVGDTCKIIADLCAPAGGPTLWTAPCQGTDDLGILTTSLEQSEFGYYEYGKGTSEAAAMVSGVAALVWASNPELTADEIKYALRLHAKKTVTAEGADFFIGAPWGLHRDRGFYSHYETQCPFPVLDPELPWFWPSEGDLKSNGNTDFDSFCSPVFGSGMVDADVTMDGVSHRTIYSIFGGVLEENTVLDAPDAVYLFGDVVIPAGKELMISGGTDVAFRVFDGDLQESGDDPTRTEIVVQAGGRLVIESDSIFRGDKYAENLEGLWGGIVVESGGFLGSESGEYSLAIYDSKKGLSVLSEDIQLASLEIHDSSEVALTIGNTFECSGVEIINSGEIGCELLGGGHIICESLQILNPDVSSGIYGIKAHAGSWVDASGILQVSRFAICSKFDNGGQVLGDGRWDLQGCTIGLVVDDGELQFPASNNIVKCLGPGVGIQTWGASLSIAAGGSLTISDCSYGLQILNSDSVHFGGGIIISEPENCGVWVKDTFNLTLDQGLSVFGAAQDGIKLDGCIGASISGVYVERCSGSGVSMYNGSMGQLRNSTFVGNNTNIFVGPQSGLDAGVSGVDLGCNNIFDQLKPKTMFHFVNLNTSSEAHADGNLWGVIGGGACPPDPKMISGLVSTNCN